MPRRVVCHWNTFFLAVHCLSCPPPQDPVPVLPSSLQRYSLLSLPSQIPEFQPASWDKEEPHRPGKRALPLRDAAHWCLGPGFALSSIPRPRVHSPTDRPPSYFSGPPLCLLEHRPVRWQRLRSHLASPAFLPCALFLPAVPGPCCSLYLPGLFWCLALCWYESLPSRCPVFPLCPSSVSLSFRVHTWASGYLSHSVWCSLTLDLSPVGHATTLLGILHSLWICHVLWDTVPFLAGVFSFALFRWFSSVPN